MANQPKPDEPENEGIERRDFLKRSAAFLQTKAGLATAGGVTLAAVAAYQVWPRDDEEQAPLQFGPVTIGVKPENEIIPKKYERAAIKMEPLTREEHETILPFLYAVYSGDTKGIELCMTDSHAAVDYLAKNGDPALRNQAAEFLRAYPDKFTMSDKVRRIIIGDFHAFTIQKGRLDERQFINTCVKLVEYGADPFELFAAKGNNLYVDDFERVLKAIPDKNDPKLLPAFPPIVMKREGKNGWKRVQIAIEQGMNINAVPSEGLPNTGTALHTLIANEGFDDAVRLIGLMGKRYDPNIRDIEGKTALIIAAKTNSAKVVKALLDTYKDTIDVNAQDNEGRTALHYAAAYGNKGMAEALLAAGAKLDIGDNTRAHRTPLDYAKLSATETGDILKSIEIDARRNKGAIWNAILTEDKRPFGDRDGKAILATKANMEKNYDDFVRAVKERAEQDRRKGMPNADEQLKLDLQMLDQQRAAMKDDISLMQTILQGRDEVGRLLKNAQERGGR